MMSKTLIEGPISEDYIRDLIQKHHNKTHLGAHALFIGQVRADTHDSGIVSGIEYSAYEKMVDQTIQEIKDLLFKKYNDLICVHIRHSKGWVPAGHNSLLVMVSSGHRTQAFQALESCVEMIKEKLPVWKKEIYDEGKHRWVDPH